MGTHAVQRLTSCPLQQAWDSFEITSFLPAVRTFLPIQLIDLLNPPYGHDYNTLTLLFAAWIGFRQHELRLSLNGRRVALSGLKDLFDDAKHPQDFLNRICVLSPLLVSRTSLMRFSQKRPAFWSRFARHALHYTAGARGVSETGTGADESTVA